MKKRIIIILLLAFICSSHEFWLNPEKFFYQKGETATVLLQVGENFEGSPWKGTILRLGLFQPLGEEKPINVEIDTNRRSIKVPLAQEGTNILVLQNKPSKIELEAEKFNAYLKEDGLEEILAYRKQNGLENTSGREIYERCAKLLFKVGKMHDKNFSRMTNLPLEIVPLNNPYAGDLEKQKSRKVYFKVYFQGKPVANLSVKFWQKFGNELLKQEAKTSKYGEVTFEFLTKGKIMISAVKMIPHTKPEEADWHSYWASLVFGYTN
ncbi:MAG: hypothetical protein OHK0045_07180 [Raineya sp.]